MKKITWVFINADQSLHKEILEEKQLPQIGDGKVYNGRGYQVRIVGNNLLTLPDGFVVAEEHQG